MPSRAPVVCAHTLPPGSEKTAIRRRLCHRTFQEERNRPLMSLTRALGTIESEGSDTAPETKPFVVWPNESVVNLRSGKADLSLLSPDIWSPFARTKLISTAHGAHYVQDCAGFVRSDS